MRDLLGVTELSSAGDQPPSALLYADFDGPPNADAWRLYQEVGEKIATEVMEGPNRSRFISCDPASEGCLTETIRSFGRKAFRRPLTDDEVERFEALGQTTPPGTPEEVAHTTLLAFLVSPSFLQITETSTEMEGNAIKLSHHEVAARLSFLLWDSIPDEILDAAADSGELGTKEQILEQAVRMIQVRDKTAPVVALAHRHYFGMDDTATLWWKRTHDPERYPLFSEAAMRAFRAEVDAFFEDVAFENGSFKDLFSSPIAHVNQDTAAIYGLAASDYDAEPTRVELDPTERPGVLTRGGFLSSFSNFDATSPMLRGSFISMRLLGVNPGAPLPGVASRPRPPGEYATQRDYVEALTSSAECRGCHAIIDQSGFVLELYDAIGKWQTVDPRGGAINPAARVMFSQDHVKCIGSPLELMKEIVATPKANYLYAQKWVSFATRRLPNANDECIVELIASKLARQDYEILDLLADLTQTDSFRLRVRGN
jgi:hypothetical protein